MNSKNKHINNCSSSNRSVAQGVAQRKPNNTGLPGNLKMGIERLSGYSMDDVKVHYNSPKPAQLNAHAYAQGNNIHMASGQEKHLPHEAWHVVQQKQGRVKPTMMMKAKIPINDNTVLEKEADRMGDKVNSLKVDISESSAQLKVSASDSNTAQLKNGRGVGKHVNRSKGNNVNDQRRQVGRMNAERAARVAPQPLILPHTTRDQTKTLIRIEPNVLILNHLIGQIAAHSADHLINLYNLGADTGQLITLFGYQRSGIVLDHFIRRIAGQDIDGLITLFRDHLTSPQINTLLGHNLDGTQLHLQINRVAGHSFAHLDGLYQTGYLDGTQISALLAHNADGMQLLYQINRIAGHSFTDLDNLYRTGHLDGAQTSALLAHNADGTQLHYQINRIAGHSFTDLDNLYRTGHLDGAQTSALLAHNVDGTQLLYQINQIAGHSFAHLDNLYQTGHLDGPQISALLAHNADGTQLHYQINRIAGHSYAHLDGLYQTGHLDGTQISGLLAHNADGTQLHHQITTIVGNRYVDLNQLYVDAFTPAEINTMLGLVTNGHELHQMHLIINDYARLIRLLRPLRADGLNINGIQIRQTIQRLNGAGRNSLQIEADITNLRGNLNHAAPAAPAQTPITQHGGQQKLSGQDIHDHIAHSVAQRGPAAATAAGTHYPTGQLIPFGNVNQLWANCAPGAIHNDITSGAPETAGQQGIRQKQALNALRVANAPRSQLIQNIFLHNNGQTPRAFVSVAQEDGFEAPTAHTQDKHVLGAGGVINTLDDLARRAAFKVPAPNPGTGASAFNNAAQADGQVGAAIAAGFTPNWIVIRNQLTTGALVPSFKVPAVNPGIRYRKTDNPAYPQYPLPLTPALAARPLRGPVAAPPAPALPPLTFDNSVALTRVNIVIHANGNVLGAHGWNVYTSYPCLP